MEFYSTGEINIPRSHKFLCS